MTKQSERTGAEFKRFNSVVRQVISVSAPQLIEKSYLVGEALPLVIEPALDDVNLRAWAEHHREDIEAELLHHGAILFRGLRAESAEEFEKFARTISPQLLEYKERSSPRSEIVKGIYTSTDYPADQSIHFHNEQSYTQSWPLKLWFFCAQPATRGGATLIADGRRVLKLLDAGIKERFLRNKVMYVRNYVDGIGLSWREAFQTSDRSEVENYCSKSCIDFEWKEGGRLRTSQVFDTIVAHPKTGEMVWFEHAAFFHVSSLESGIRETFLKEYDAENLPFNTYYGDGAPIEASVLSRIRETYRQVAVRFQWQKGDVLLIDNMLTSHGRESFEGSRKILVAMADIHSRSTC